jgi:hypothetical protein
VFDGLAIRGLRDAKVFELRTAALVASLVHTRLILVECGQQIAARALFLCLGLLALAAGLIAALVVLRAGKRRPGAQRERQHGSHRAITIAPRRQKADGAQRGANDQDGGGADELPPAGALDLCLWW